ncbi:MAG: hypothetical protein ABI891_13100 [Acidobacteriota bacterium]
MKKILILAAFVFATAIFSNIFGQQAAPPGAGDKDLNDKNVKTRSIDLERVDRDARKENGKTTEQPAKNSVTVKNQPEDKLAAKYGEIKTDYEQIQLSQDTIIKTYQGSGTIDYAQIGKSASEINSSAKRLSSNLFPPPIAEGEGKEVERKPEKEAKTTKSIRDLIVDLDNSVGSFAMSSMFQNLRLIDPKVAIKTQADLKNIIELSATLNAEAEKMGAKK